MRLEGGKKRKREREKRKQKTSYLRSPPPNGAAPHDGLEGRARPRLRLRVGGLHVEVAVDQNDRLVSAGVEPVSVDSRRGRRFPPVVPTRFRCRPDDLDVFEARFFEALRAPDSGPLDVGLPLGQGGDRGDGDQVQEVLDEPLLIFFERNVVEGGVERGRWPRSSFFRCERS